MSQKSYIFVKYNLLIFGTFCLHDYVKSGWLILSFGITRYNFATIISFIKIQFSFTPQIIIFIIRKSQKNKISNLQVIVDKTFKGYLYGPISTNEFLVTNTWAIKLHTILYDAVNLTKAEAPINTSMSSYFQFIARKTLVW